MSASAASLLRRAAHTVTGSARTGVAVTNYVPGAGGSAMPCGLHGLSLSTWSRPILSPTSCSSTCTVAISALHSVRW